MLYFMFYMFFCLSIRSSEMLLNGSFGFRLQSVTPVSYVEIHKVKAEKSLGDEKNLVREGREAEVYTEEHDKLLGTYEENWELFKDGYGDDGKRIYDPIKGKTCHQCRLGFTFFSLLCMRS